MSNTGLDNVVATTMRLSQVDCSGSSFSLQAFPELLQSGHAGSV